MFHLIQFNLNEHKKMDLLTHKIYRDVKLTRVK